jgi:hypothetical protein
MARIINPAFANHIRLTLSGEFAGQSGLGEYERFSFGVNLSDPSDISSSRFSADGLADVVADSSAFFARPGTFISGDVRLREVKLARIAPDGTYRADPLIASVNVPGGSGPGLRYPPQVSLAVSLQTATRGPRGKGRFYLPGPSIGFDNSTAQISVGDATAVRDSATTWIVNLNDWPGVDGQDPRVTVASSAGMNSDVTGVRVGRVLDTIRSRRGQIPEGYTPLSVI